MDKRKVVIILLTLSLLCMFSCSNKRMGEVLCKYDDFNCSYYTKDIYKQYKYSDYIMDDISNGLYKKSSPSIADYKLGTGLLDYDIPAYVQAKMDYAIKNELIDKYELSIDEICSKVRDEYFNQRNAYVYYYDESTKKETLLYDGLVSNITYDDETPIITFDVPSGSTNLKEKYDGRRIMLSDIIAANSSIDGYMRVILGTDKTKYKFFMNKRVDNDNLYNGILATDSEIN